MATTPRWGLPYPTSSDAPNGPVQIQNLATDLDGVAMDDQGTLALMPTASKRGRYYYTTDTGQLFRDNGTAWIEIPVASAISSSILQPGDLKATARASAPTGWLICDGTAVSRSTYADLFAAIGTNYGGGDGTTTFGLPDLRGRTPVGVDGSAGRLSAADALGNAGGEEKHALTSAEEAPHTHPFSGTTAAETTDHIHDIAGVLATIGSGGVSAFTLVNWGTAGSTSLTASGRSSSHTHSLSGTTSTPTGGAGSAHNNLQPYQIVNWLVKT